MLRITVELIPFGNEDQKKKIGEMVAANVSFSRENGNGYSYDAWIAADNWSGTPALFAQLKGYDRNQSVWELIRTLIEAARPVDPQEGNQRLLERLEGQE